MFLLVYSGVECQGQGGGGHRLHLEFEVKAARHQYRDMRSRIKNLEWSGRRDIVAFADGAFSAWGNGAPGDVDSTSGLSPLGF